ncbi:protein BREAST CANCER SUSCEPTIBILITY 2 homolog B-like [Cornus florida]|uniref:protein BREAST CANCER SUSCEPTIBILITY 2 homolog B-like n=1 Tax=Cornus florida TaxID=4283 RepID=UPI0028974554|nr:protein BREAST CANCER SUSCEPTIBILITY 2 homolog B-like [Cornus florida]
MSRWQIVSDASNNFRWEIPNQHLHIKPDEEPTSSPPTRLPSMDDLLLQGCSNLLENHNGHVESPPMFRSGLGKSVTVKQSSISKALSILGDEGDAFAHTGQLFGGRENGLSLMNSMFQTGSGKAVNISSSGLVKAKTLLDLEENNKQENFQGLEQTRKQSPVSEPFGWQTNVGVDNAGFEDAASVPISSFTFKTSTVGVDSRRDAIPDFLYSAPKPPPIKFHTAGGRSLSVSTDALQRARSLLGDLELGSFLNEGDANDPVFSFFKERRHDDNLLVKENKSTTLTDQETVMSKNMSISFISPMKSTSNPLQSSVMSENVNSGNNLIKSFDAEDYDSPCKSFKNTTCPRKPLSNKPHVPSAVIGDSLANGIGSRINPRGRSSGRPLTDISNSISMNNRDKICTGEKRGFGKRSSISPFKRPRSSRFITPLNNKTLLVSEGSSAMAPEDSCYKGRISTRYPIKVPRIYIKEHFGMPPSHQNMSKHLPDQLRRMNPDNAEKYMFCDGYGLASIGAEAFCNMLAESGASMQYVSKDWVANHYKWIVWKLACYERCYPTKSSGKLLTVSNVLEELKYRYEREVNYGHRSAIKRILEGDMPPSTMLVLCISSIYSNRDPKIETHTLTSNGAENSPATKIELTDGWYSVNALLDGLLSKELATGKIFVGQKLRIWGAGLCGWISPVSPLEASRTISLLLHINGTYRAHWADRLGLCKGDSAPLAFRCIKSMGGPVPSTLVGVTRIYPVLYRERLSTGGFIVRSERMEAKMMQLYNQRCSTVAEGIMSEFQRGIKDFNINNDNDSEEGAKILRILESAAEPEVLMAEMSSEQLTYFAAYQEKLQAIRQSDMQKSIEKALEDAGLSEREVTPFMRVRVVGLTSKSNPQNFCPREGLITIWNPTEKQQSGLVEGQAYAIAGLIPLNSDSDTLYLQARGGTTKWLQLSPSALEHFEQFFSPRKSVFLSNLGEVPLSSEFDIAALVVYVGEVYTTAHQKKQWVFVTDGSISELDSEDPTNSLLAISFCSPSVDCDSFVPINYNLAGSMVGFFNLIKRAKDQMNHLWVAEATENSTYFLSYDHAQCSHLKAAAVSTERWAKASSLKIEKLREKVLSIIGNCGG